MHRGIWIGSLAALAVAGAVVAGGGAALDRDDRHRAFAYSFYTGDDDHGGAWLGVSIDEATELDEGGARIVDVVEGSPADDAGLRAGDVVVGLDGRAVRGPRALIERVGALEPGDGVVIELIRDGARRVVELELGERAASPHAGFRWHGSPDSPEQMERLHEHLEELRERFGEMEFDFDFDFDAPEVERFRFAPLQHRRPRLGVELTALTPELREHMGADREAGVLVARLMPGMPAEAAGVLVGDVIDSVDGEPVRDAGDLVRALDGREGTAIRLGIVRDGRSTTIDVRLPEPDAPPSSVGPRA